MTLPLDNPSGDEPSDDELLAAFVGRNWNEHFRDSFAAIRAGRSNLGATFNTAAALAPLWLAYRGFLVLQFASFFAFIAVSVAGIWLVDAITRDAEALLLLPLVMAYAVVGAAAGLAGDLLLYRRAVAVTGRLRLKHSNREALLAAVRKAGGVYTTGVAVPPVVMVVLVIVLVPLLPHRLFHNHEGAYLAAMKSDLRNLVTAQESYFADSSTYLAGALLDDSTAVYDSSWAPRFTPSSGVMISIGVATATAWNATARRAAKAETICGIFIGDAPPPVRGAREGEPMCVDQ